MSWGNLAAGAALSALLLAGVAPPAGTDCAPASRPLIAEILYDAAGDDTGLEFIELFNPTASEWELAGVRIEAGDGSTPGRWSLRWTGGSGDRVATGARFVVGGSGVAGAHAVATLDLQNGPDAVRVVWPDGTIEVVGYGAHEFLEYACGAPASDAPSGYSLARVPDDAVHGSNAEDFRADRPSPGRPNQVARDAALAPGTIALDPPQPDAEAAVRVRAAVVSRGASTLEAGTVGVTFWLDERLLGSYPIAYSLTAAETAWAEVHATAGPAGKRTLRARTAAVDDGAPDNDGDSLRVRVGPGPLAPVEIQFHPERGEGEWIEIQNTSTALVDVSGFRIADRTAAGATVAPGAWLEADSLAVVCQDRAAFLAHHPDLDPARVWEARPWAALNNSDATDGFADIVRIVEADGTPCAQVSYSAADVPDGVTIERRPGGAWGPSLDAAGTPLRPPRLPVPLASSFEISPRRVALGAPVRIEWSLPWPRATLAIGVYDLEGAFVAHAAAGLEAAARGGFAWIPRDLRPGVYVVSLVARSSEGASVSAARVLGVGVAP